MPDQLFFDIVKMVVALAAIIGLVFAVVWLMKRFLPGAARAAGERVDMYVVGQLSVGSRQRVAVVRVHDRVLVLGITEESITTLADLTPPRDAAKDAGASSKEADDPKIFADLLAWPKDGPQRAPAGQPGQPARPAAPAPAAVAAAELAGKNLGAIDKDAIRDLFDSLSAPPKKS